MPIACKFCGISCDIFFSDIFYDHICLQILCNFIDIFFSDHLAWSLLVDSVQFVNIFPDYCLQLCNFIDIFSDCLARSWEFCAILLSSSQMFLGILCNSILFISDVLGNSVQFHCLHLRLSCIITHYKFIHIFSEHLATLLLAFSVQFYWYLLRSSCMIIVCNCCTSCSFLLVLVGGLLTLMQGCAS
jgi:hypothetical protein